MGVVYKAKDTKLDRTVALKFLPSHLTQSKKDKQRFTREAKSAAALDHPNVCTIYEVGESQDGTLYISMAYYDGETLADRLEKEPVKYEEALDLAIQNGYDYVICGHIHQPKIRGYETEEGTVIYMNSGDWIENLTALEYNRREWSMYKYAEDDFIDKTKKAKVPIRRAFENTAVIG